jgi:antitoxin component YwqK of YwqJK toxin-antitoxin module
MQKRIALYALFILFIHLPVLLIGQTSERPKYAPSKNNHRNDKDQYDRKQGVWQLYSASRVLIAEINYLNDKKHGLSTRYYPHSGTIMEQAEYFDGRLHGGYKKFFYTGALKTEGDYDYNKRDGYWVNYYHTTGEISSEGNYVKGKKDGDWKFYDSKGKIKYTYTYKLGVLVAKNGVSLEELKKQENEKSQTITIPKK